MSSAVLRHAVLMNWRGCFYQSYELDRTVTALEGDNGAGKTTVMIAVYVALLPDLRLLRFSNVSEGEGGGGSERGLQGRLGPEGHAYSILDLLTPTGERLLAGVQLIPHARSQVDLKPFLIDGLDLNLPLEKLLLLQEQGQERIPDLVELRQQALRLGGRLERQDTVTDYLKGLFDRGILPMRMEQTTEREKFNQLLRTSMYGGLSSAIQRYLKEYLLGEDTGLRSLVGTMRENLDACRTTRRQIEHTQQKFETIRRVYDAGYGMLEAGFHATRVRAKELRQNLEASSAAHRAEKRRHREQAAGGARLQEVHRRLETRVAHCREQLELTERERLRLEEARKLTVQCEVRRGPLEQAKQTHSTADAAQIRAQTKRDAARDTRAAVLREKEAIARRLSSAQEAWEAVLSEVEQYRAAVRSLQDAQRALPDEPITPATAKDVRDRCELAWNDALNQEATCRRELETAAIREQRFRRVFDALQRLAGSTVSESEAAELAQLVDEETRDRTRRVKEGADLPARIMGLDRKHQRQRALHESLSALGPDCGALESAEALRTVFRTIGDAVTLLDQRREQLQTEHRALQQRQAPLQTDVNRLETERESWQKVRALADELERVHALPFPDGASVESLRHRLEDERRTRERRKSELEPKRLERHARLTELEQTGGRLSPTLLALADRVHGDLLVSRYDDVEDGRAAEVEARLGPLASALVVEDIGAAGALLAGIAERPPELWLVDAAQAHRLPEGRPFQDAMLIDMGIGSRLTRLPEHPVVGSRAREREKERLKKEIAGLDRQLEEETASLRDLASVAPRLELLWRQAGWLDRPDPRPELERLQREIRRLQEENRSLEQTLAQINAELRTGKQRRQQLEALLPDADLLDLPDLARPLRDLKQEQTALKALAQTLKAQEPDLMILREGRLELLQPPPPPEQQEALRETQKRARAALDRLQNARHVLDTLCDRLPGFRFAGSERLLEQQQGALEELRKRQAATDGAYEQAVADEAAADETLKASVTRLNAAEALFMALSQELERLSARLEELGGEVAESELDAVRMLVREAVEAHQDADQAEREAQQQVTRVATQLEALAQTVAALRLKRLEDQQPLRLSLRNLLQLRRAAQEKGWLERLMLLEVVQIYDRLGTVNANTQARERRAQLIEALRAAEKAEDVLAAVEAATRDDTDRLRGLQYLEAWSRALGYLTDIMPRDVVQADDPGVALDQLERHLATLQDRLLRQETLLRQSSESIANSLLSRINKEIRQIQRLNEGLREVAFGSIRGVRIHVEQIELMKRLLNGLREQREQMALFSKDMPLEEAMSALYKQLGGGQIRGEQLLDYREYLRLTVQVQRLGAGRWEQANPTSLSTGESIGVGSSILMVILDAWERQAALFRTKGLNSSLRFLFLDEATRLSHDSLSTLLDFCDRMNLQLLIAAPAVDRARRGTTYRLVRTADAQGREEVMVVRGRRGFQGADGPENASSSTHEADIEGAEINALDPARA